jgi:hypothetical protein
VELSNFVLHKLNKADSDAVKEKLAEGSGFIASTDNAYIAEFEIDGVKYDAGTARHRAQH